MKHITNEQRERMLDLAYEARDRAYTPYSHYNVGACLLCADGTYYQGCNIENAAYTPTSCAERTAFFKAVYDGHRDFAAIAVTSSGNTPSYPCGVCRQVMAEFCDRDFLILTADRERNVVQMTLEEMLPRAFTPKDLK